MTGRQNIYLNGTILGLNRKEIDRNFDDIVAFSGLERFLDTPVKRYSSGMTVRLGFSVAACIKTDILLVDEVLAVGDASFRQKCLNRIHSLLDSGTSIIFVSHSLSMVQAVCRSAIFLDHGQIKSRGSTTDVINVYERDIHKEKARKFESSQYVESNTKTTVEVIQIEVLDANTSNKPEEFHSDHAVEIRIHYKAYRLIGTVNATVLILSVDGLLCCSMRTNIDNVHLSLHKGEGVISVILDPLQLVGGTYVVEARLTNITSTLTLATGWSKSFFVTDPAFIHGTQRGVFEPSRRWEHRQLI